MATAIDIITRALRLIGAQAQGETPRADDAQDALLALNAMLQAWEGDGIRFGNAYPAALADTLNLSARELDAVAHNLAVRIAPEYGAGASPLLLDTADKLRRQVQAIYFDRRPARLDPTLIAGQVAVVRVEDPNL